MKNQRIYSANYHYFVLTVTSVGGGGVSRETNRTAKGQGPELERDTNLE